MVNRKPNGERVDGWLAVDKPAGPSSAKVVSISKQLLSAQKAGHGGTLDPFATGVLPIAFGEATKTVEYVMRGNKVYRFTIRWGEERDTDDCQGSVVGTSDVRPSITEIEAALGFFQGEVEQVPPAFSAIKTGGRRAYAIARSGQVPELMSRRVRIDRLQLVSWDDADHATFDMVCGKGTYVRALARDLGAWLGTVGHVTALHRRRTGPFDENQAISLDSLEALGHSSARSQYLLPVEAALADIPAIALTNIQAEKLRHGETVHVESPETGVRCAMSSGRLIAIAELANGRVRPKRVFDL